MSQDKPQRSDSGYGSKLDEHLETIVQQKLAGMSDRAIGDNLGVSNSAVSRYVKRPYVAAAINQAHGELMKRAHRQLAMGAGWAVQALLRQVDPKHKDEIPLRYQNQAAKILLDTIQVGRIADSAELSVEIMNQQAADSARSKVAAIEARVLEAEADEELSSGLRVVGGRDDAG